MNIYILLNMVYKIIEYTYTEKTYSVSCWWKANRALDNLGIEMVFIQLF